MKIGLYKETDDFSGGGIHNDIQILTTFFNKLLINSFYNKCLFIIFKKNMVKRIFFTPVKTNEKFI